jgi:hypothetical protein
MKEEVLLLTHKMNKTISSGVEKLKEEVGKNRALTILSQDYSTGFKDIDEFIFSLNSLKNLGYPMFGDTVVPGHTHFPLLSYYRTQQEKSDYYWLIEYDVRYSGKWFELFDYFSQSDADFISSYIRYYSEEPNFFWWKLENPDKEIALENRVRSFNPIYRISERALKFLDIELKKGWVGHYEVVIPSLLYHASGFEILDFGGDGLFTEQKNRFYTSRTDMHGKITSGTMRYIPAMAKPGLRPNMIYHPVKENGLGRGRFLVGNLYRALTSKLNKRLT